MSTVESRAWDSFIDFGYICRAGRADSRFDEAGARLRLRHWRKLGLGISGGSPSKPEAAVFFWLIGFDG